MFSVCQQDYTKTNNWSFMKPGGEVEHIHRHNKRNLGVNFLDGLDRRINFHLEDADGNFFKEQNQFA